MASSVSISSVGQSAGMSAEAGVASTIDAAPQPQPGDGEQEQSAEAVIVVTGGTISVFGPPESIEGRPFAMHGACPR